MITTINAHIKNRIGSPEEWKSSNYVPLEGELIIYDFGGESHKRLKVGDGIHAVTELSFIDDKSQYKATPSTLVDIIRYVEEGATINLEAGQYELLNLHGKDSFPANLTIVGRDGVKMAGISITSAIKTDEINTTKPNKPDYESQNSDISSATLPAGLTIKDINFTDSLSLRNCKLDDLSIIDCTFAQDAFIDIQPNAMFDCFGNDSSQGSIDKANFKVRRNYAKILSKNLLIRGCTFAGSSGSKQGTLDAKYNTIEYLGDCAIRVSAIDGLTIYKNYIEGTCAYRGIEINGTDYHLYSIYNAGRIHITNNSINTTGSHGIFISCVKNGDVVVTSNALANSNTATSAKKNKEYIKAQECINTSFDWGFGTGISAIYNNKHKDVSLSVDSGITAEQSDFITDKQAQDFCKKNPVYVVYSNSELSNVLKTAEPNSTIQLNGDMGNSFNLIELVGYDSYPENLTIIGGGDVSLLTTISGISISSGLIDPTYTTDCNYKTRMPSNLTLKNLAFQDSLCLRNCSIDGLNIVDCNFECGANIDLSPVSLVDKYGRDTASTAATVWRKSSAKPHIKNVTITGNHFYDPRDYGVSVDDTVSAIKVNCVDNIEISNNRIDHAAWNGIQINGQNKYYSTGRIGIFKNTILSTGSRSINVAFAKDAEVFIHTNGLRYANQKVEDKSSCIDVIYGTNVKLECDLAGKTNFNTYADPLLDENGNVVYEEGESYWDRKIVFDTVRSVTIGDGITFDSTDTFKYDSSTQTLYINM